MADSGKLLTALFVGAAAGAAVGLLFAPDKGTETRRRLAGAAQDIADEANNYWAEGKSALRNVRDRVANGAEELRDKAENRIDSLKDRAHDLAGDAERGLNQAKDRARSATGA